MEKPSEFSELIVYAIKAWGWRYVLEKIAYAYDYAPEIIKTSHPQFYKNIAIKTYNMVSIFQREEDKIRNLREE